MRKSFMMESNKCDECGYTFAEKDTLKKHKIAVHDIKSYKCNECEYTFAQKATLSNHKRSAHEKLRNYWCN